MPTQLLVLMLRDNPADLEPLAGELARFGFKAVFTRVATEAEYSERLREMPDLVLAHHSNPSHGGIDTLRALEILQESQMPIPFIVLAGTGGEEQAVEYLHKGAADYVSRDRILRLGPAVERALAEARERRQKMAADEALRRQNSQLEEQYQRALNATRMKSIFLANMSHELRTPLTAVIGFAELLVDGKVGPLSPQQLEFTRDILSNGRHLLSLINDVLDLARVESGTMAFHPQRLCLPDLIRETIAGFRLQASERNITLTTDVQMSAIEVFLDPMKFKQVLLNYVSNALKFTPPGGRVTVHARFEEGSTFRLEVEDTGRGIAARDIGRLFQDFQQLGGGSSEELQGTGLGLALTKRLVEAQGGKVGVVSQPGKGSRFFADLPCSAEWIQTDLKRLNQGAAATAEAEAYSEPAPQVAGAA